jgi:hypothetical protein
MPRTNLIIVNANDDSNFTYTDFATGEDASSYLISAKDKLSWIVFSAASLIGYRIDFKKNGSPFVVESIVVPSGGISRPQEVTTVTGGGMLYSVTLSDFRLDDPEVRPVDGIMAQESKRDSLPQQIAVEANNGVILINPDPAQYPAGTWVRWVCNEATFQIDFTKSGHNPPSPFLDPATNTGPLPQAQSKTASEMVRPLNAGETSNFKYTVTVGGITKTGTFIIG